MYVQQNVGPVMSMTRNKSTALYVGFVATLIYVTNIIWREGKNKFYIIVNSRVFCFYEKTTQSCTKKLCERVIDKTHH